MRPSSTYSCITALSRARRGPDMPTDSGVAAGRPATGAAGRAAVTAGWTATACAPAIDARLRMMNADRVNRFDLMVTSGP